MTVWQLYNFVLSESHTDTRGCMLLLFRHCELMLQFDLKPPLSSCVCVSMHVQVLSVHTPVSEPASCCPTLLLPWWTPFGLQQVLRCVCLFMCATFAFVCVSVHGCMSVQEYLWLFVCMHMYCQRARCQPVFYWVHVSSVIRHWDSCRRSGVMTQTVGGRGPCPLLVRLFVVQSVSPVCLLSPLLKSILFLHRLIKSMTSREALTVKFCADIEVWNNKTMFILFFLIPPFMPRKQRNLH